MNCQLLFWEILEKAGSVTVKASQPLRLPKGGSASGFSAPREEKRLGGLPRTGTTS
jgi:hypothetical protein